MFLHDLLRRMRDCFDGFNAPTSDGDLSHLQEVVGQLPEEVLVWYRDHDGSANLPRRGGAWLPARLLPVREAIDLHDRLAAWPQEQTLGTVAWLWTDDNSNYVGIYTSGPVKGWLTVLDHEEPQLTPAFRTVTSFLSRTLSVVPGIAADEDAAYTANYVPREIPSTEPDSPDRDNDDRLAQLFREKFRRESDPDRRRFYAICAICMTPVEDTASVVPFLTEDDMWIPEAAVNLLELRRFRGAVDELERLAREGRHNGAMAAMRQLVRLRTNASRAAVARLQSELPKQKLAMLQMWLQNSDRLQPPRWR